MQKTGTEGKLQLLRLLPASDLGVRPQNQDLALHSTLAILGESDVGNSEVPQTYEKVDIARGGRLG